MWNNDKKSLDGDSRIIHKFSISENPDTPLLDEQNDGFGGQVEQKSTEIQASFNLFKVFVGPGILALPASFANVGFLLGVLGILGAGYLTYYGMYLLLQVVQDMKSTKGMNLQGIADKVIGRWGKLSVEISLVIMQAGIGIAILIFSTKFLNNLVCDSNSESLCNNKFFLIVVALSIVTPLSFINNLHYFYISSLLATFFVFVNVIVQIVLNFSVMSEQDAGTIFSRMTEFKITNLPLFFGVATYAFEGIGVIFSVRLSMQDPSRFPKILQTLLLVITFLYAFFPGTSELAFGKDVPDIILFSFPKHNSFYLLIQVLYVISSLLGYPVQMFPVFKIVENSLGLQNVEETRQIKIRRIAARLVLIAIMLYIALAARSFNLFLNLMGSGVFTYLGYLLPIMVYHYYFRDQVPERTRTINIIVFAIGSVLGVMGIIFSLQDIINYEGN